MQQIERVAWRRCSGRFMFRRNLAGSGGMLGQYLDFDIVDTEGILIQSVRPNAGPAPLEILSLRSRRLDLCSRRRHTRANWISARILAGA